jgi:hypothetical protein
MQDDMVDIELDNIVNLCSLDLLCYDKVFKKHVLNKFKDTCKTNFNYNMIKNANEDLEDELWNIIHKINVINPNNVDAEPTFIELRSYTIDWLYCICNKLKYTSRTFILSCEILDKIIIKYNTKLSENDIHLISMVSLFISSKYYEPNCIKIKFLESNIAHNKFSLSEILGSELLILKILTFKLQNNYFYEFTNIILCQLFGDSCSNKNCLCLRMLYSFIEVTYLVIIFNFQLFAKTNLTILYFSIIYLSIFEVFKNFKFEEYLNKLVEIITNHTVDLNELLNVKNSVHTFIHNMVTTQKDKLKYFFSAPQSELFQFFMSI